MPHVFYIWLPSPRHPRSEQLKGDLEGECEQSSCMCLDKPVMFLRALCFLPFKTAKLVYVDFHIANFTKYLLNDKVKDDRYSQCTGQRMSLSINELIIYPYEKNKT